MRNQNINLLKSEIISEIIILCFLDFDINGKRASLITVMSDNISTALISRDYSFVFLDLDGKPVSSTIRFHFLFTEEFQ